MRILVALLALCAFTFAQSVASVTPECASPGDRILIDGEDFGEEPTVTIGGTSVEVIRHTATKILVEIPEDLAAGEATVDVDGATISMEVLEANAPLVLHQSASTATAGQAIILIGRRLRNATVELRDAEGTAVFMTDLRGRRRAGFFKISDDIATGSYDLVVVGGAEGNPESCARKLEIVAAGDATIDEATPAAQTPGRAIRFHGTDLGPLGLCRVAWTDEDGATLRRIGIANGYNKVYSRVPFQATPGATYSIVITFNDGSTTEAGGEFKYEVGNFAAPMIVSLNPSTGPAGDLVRIAGTGLFAGREIPKVEFTQGDVAVQARVYAGFVALGDRNDNLIVLVPGDLADGDYDVTVTAGDQVSNAEVFTVETPALTVTSMTPTRQSARGPRRPVVIKGSGFGPIADIIFKAPPAVSGANAVFRPIDWKLSVTWDDGQGGDPLEGTILTKNDSRIVVLTPGGWRNPLAVGTYTVRVTRDPGTDSEETVEAGTFTVQ